MYQLHIKEKKLERFKSKKKKKRKGRRGEEGKEGGPEAWREPGKHLADPSQRDLLPQVEIWMRQS